MKIIDTGFDGLILIEPQIFEDHRGRFFESWSNKDYKNIGIKNNFVQDDLSYSNKNVLRGLHFQKGQSKIVSIVEGVIFDVAVDIRKESPTYGQHFPVVLDSKKPMQLYIPYGFAHGFCVLSEHAILHYKLDTHYDPSIQGGIIYNDANIGINWPVNDPILSIKDQNFLTFKDTLCQ